MEIKSKNLHDRKRHLIAKLRKEFGSNSVIDAMERVPREAFIPPSLIQDSYEDSPIPIEAGQTTSQPYIIAKMIIELDIHSSDKILEIGTGYGYQSAILSQLCDSVTSVERIKSMVQKAKKRLVTLEYSNIEVHEATSELGWVASAPYDAIIVGAAAPKIPIELFSQLVVGGRLIIPVGSMATQDLMKITKTADSFTAKTLIPCKFVPLIGKGAWPLNESLKPGYDS